MIYIILSLFSDYLSEKWSTWHCLENIASMTGAKLENTKSQPVESNLWIMNRWQWFISSIPNGSMTTETQLFHLKSTHLKHDGYTCFHFTKCRPNLFHSLELKTSMIHTALIYKRSWYWKKSKKTDKPMCNALILHKCPQLNDPQEICWKTLLWLVKRWFPCIYSPFCFELSFEEFL